MSFVERFLFKYRNDVNNMNEFIEESIALNEYILTKNDLLELKYTSYGNEILYTKKEIRNVCIKKWGSIRRMKKHKIQKNIIPRKSSYVFAGVFV